MSKIFGPVVRAQGSGLLHYSPGAGALPAGAYFGAGLWLDVGGRVLATDVDPVDHYSHGLPFSAEGRLVVVGSGTPAYFDQGVGFNVTGAAGVAGAAPTHTDQGCKHSGGSRLSISSTTP